MDKPITKVTLIKGGNIIKQGHDFALEFNLFDGEGALVDLADSAVAFKIAQRTGGVVYEGTAQILGVGHIGITVDEDVGFGDRMRVEFTATNDGVTQKFPADDFVRLRITASLDTLETGEVTTITLEQLQNSLSKMQSEYKAVVDDEVSVISGKADEALDASTIAKATAESVRDEFDTILTEGPVQTVNGKTGIITGLAEQSEVNSLTAQLAQKAPLSSTIETSVGKPARVYLGVIRNTGAGWFYIEDTVHEKLNFTTVDVNTSNEIRVHMRAGTKVGSVLAVADETFASLGLTAGVSVGVYNSVISLYADFSGKIGGDGVINTKDWFGGTYTTVKSADGTQVTVNFDGVSDINLPFSIVPEYEGSPPFDGIDIRAYRVSLTSVIFRAFKDLYGYVSYNGSAWVSSSSCVANISATFNNTTGELTITHDGMSADAGHLAFNSLNTEMRDSVGGLIHRRVVLSNTTTIVIKFYDSAGNQIMTPNSNMRIWFNRPGFKVPHVWVSSAKAYFNIGTTKVRADKVVSTAGNIWLIGANHTS